MVYGLRLLRTRTRYSSFGREKCIIILILTCFTVLLKVVCLKELLGYVRVTMRRLFLSGGRTILLNSRVTSK
jgi:hypothetical protein